MPKSTLEIAKPHIAPFFSGCDRRVWTKNQLETALSSMREEWKLAERINIREFIDFLLRETSLVQTTLQFPSQEITRYWWGSPTIYELASSQSTSGYFSHHTALFLHGLIASEPKTVFFNIEQPAKGARPGSLQQAGIDAAFKRPSRVSNARALYGNQEICMLHGKNTGQFGVTTRKHPQYGTLRMTSVARTLVDSVVRPIYSGGIFEILGAYRQAANTLSTEELVNILQNLQHAYPYHQAIGFLLERSGAWDKTSINLFRSMPIQFNFYLDYEMSTMHYSDTWRLYYPAYLDE